MDFPTFRGMNPVIWLSESRRECKPNMDSPLLGGKKPENLLWERSRKETPLIEKGIGLSKRLELKSISDWPEKFNEFGNWPCNWLWERFNHCRFKEIFQNQSGMGLEMLSFDKLRYSRFFWDCSQAGNEGPKWHESIRSRFTWKGGTQLGLTFKWKELEPMDRYSNLLSFKKCCSERLPLIWLKPTPKTCSWESCPILSGRLPFNSFRGRYKYFRCCNVHKEEGMGPSNLLPDKTRTLRFLSSPNQFGNFPINWLWYKDNSVKLGKGLLELQVSSPLIISGKLPFKLLKPKCRYFKLQKFPMELGIEPAMTKNKNMY